MDKKEDLKKLKITSNYKRTLFFFQEAGEGGVDVASSARGRRSGRIARNQDKIEEKRREQEKIEEKLKVRELLISRVILY